LTKPFFRRCPLSFLPAIAEPAAGLRYIGAGRGLGLGRGRRWSRRGATAIRRPSSELSNFPREDRRTVLKDPQPSAVVYRRIGQRQQPPHRLPHGLVMVFGGNLLASKGNELAVLHAAQLGDVFGHGSAPFDSVVIRAAEHLRQPRDVDSDPSRLVLRQDLGLPRLVLIVSGVKVRERLPVGVADDVTAGDGSPGCWEAAGCVGYRGTLRPEKPNRSIYRGSIQSP
jgi:hypothetical protein